MNKRYQKFSEILNIEVPEIIKQYIEFKKKYEECVILFQIGEFFEAYLDDAKILAQECQIYLTEKKIKSDTIIMAGIPQKTVQDYIFKLVEKNFKVALFPQFEIKKNVFERRLERIYSKGTIFEEDYLNKEKNNYLASFFIEKNKAGLSYIELSTGDFYMCEGDINEIIEEIKRIEPTELLLPVKIREFKPFEIIENPEYDLDKQYINEFKNINKTLIKKAYFKKDKNLGKSCASAIKSHLEDIKNNIFEEIKEIKEYKVADYLLIDDVSRKSLELLKTKDDKNQGSFLWAINNTKTSMGKRLLIEWIKKPLKNKEEIIKRQNALDEYLEKNKNNKKIENILENCYDIKRLWGKIANKKINPKDFLSLKKTIKNTNILKEITNIFENEILNFNEIEYENLENFYEILERTIKDEIDDDNFIKNGANSSFDIIETEIAKLENEIKKYEEEEKTKVKGLKIAYNKVFNYYIEVSNTNIKNVPKEYKIRQSLSNASRYTTEKLILLNEKINSLKFEKSNLENEILKDLREFAYNFKDDILNLSNKIAQIDVFNSFSYLAQNKNYTKANFQENLILKDLKHPVGIKLDNNFIGNDFVANNTNSNDNFKVLTGPNMAGKSTFMKEIALNIILAQIGSYVCAKECETYVFDKIFVHTNVQDELNKGTSTFMAEMNSVKNILDNATKKSLVIFDELAKGTSTADGVKLAFAISKYIIENIKALTIFATHFHQLNVLQERFKNEVENLMIGEKFDIEEKIFDRKVKKGFLDKSYGIKVAKIANLPKEIIQYAENFEV
ncbi:MAG: DNA mismatch repair protein MutS [Cyanobacteria bacterium SIG30]|nr:DNA mismatch repair protein MutS [Cyanobacteria bacterium SIG30]